MMHFLASLKRNQNCPMNSSSVSMMWAAYSTFTVSVLLLVVCPGCAKHEEPEPPKIKLTWKEQLEASRSTILTGTWDQAESADSLLFKKHFTDEEARLYVQLQVDILQQTEGDALKRGIRRNAIQWLYDTPPHKTIIYLEWLKSGLRTNLFVDSDVIMKAREMVSRLEIYSSTNNGVGP